MRDAGQSFLSDILPPEERAIEDVVARYQRVAPAVTRFARIVSDDEQLSVRLGSQAESRAGEIVLDPGLFQAAYSRRAPVTPTEVALASALHEAVHLVATDLDDPRPLPPEWFPDDEQPPPDEPVTLLAALEEAGGPAGIALFLSLEDARQEHAHLSLYPGARSVLEDMYVAAVPAAMEEARPLGQFALACFMLVAGYAERDDLERRSETHVAAALDDAAPFLEEASTATDPWDVAGIALQLLQIATLHGLVTPAREAESYGDRQDREEDDRRAIADTVDQVRLTSPILSDRESYEETRTFDAAGEEAEIKGDSDVAGDPTTDQLIRVSEAPTVYPPVGAGGKVLVSLFPHRFDLFAPQGRAALEEAATTWQVAQRRVSGELWPLFIANQRRGLRSGYDAGDLSPYAALFLGAGLYQRMFERRAVATRHSYAVSLLVDGSASMLQPRLLPSGRRAPWGMAAATLGAWTLARLADELQIEFEVSLFNRAFAASEDDNEKSYLERMHRSAAGLRRSQGSSAERLSRTVNHYIVKSFNERWRRAEERLAGLFWTAAEPTRAGREAARHPEASPPVSMFEKAANVDEFNVTYAARRLAARHADVRIMVVLADGMTRGSIQALSETVSGLEMGGTKVLGIGIGDGTVREAYRNNQVVERPDALARAMVEGVRSSLRHTLAAWGGDAWWSRTRWSQTGDRSTSG